MQGVVLDDELVRAARDVLHNRELNSECVAGEVSAALLKDGGNVYREANVSQVPE